MLSLNKSFVLLSMLSGLLLLSACGGDDAETTSTAAPVAETTPAPAPAVEEAPAAETAASADSAASGETITLDQIEKAEGVVYQDEIYANWPTQE